MSGLGKKVSGKRVFSGRLLSLDVDEVVEPGAREQATREVVRHPGAAAVIPMLGERRVVLVRQYRYAPDKYLWEIPAGILDPGEDPSACAARELREETGYRAGSLSFMGRLNLSPGFSDEVIFLYRAEEIVPGPPNPDPQERLQVESFDLAEAVSMIREGIITDSKTVCGLLLAACEGVQFFDR